MRKLLILGIVLTLLTLPLLACAKPAPAPVSVADFYKNNIVEIVVGRGPGGGTDYTSRLVASYWATYTDGAMVVKNVVGGDGIVGTNYVYNAGPDGLIIGMSSSGSYTVGPVMFGEPNVDWKLGEFQWLGSIIEDQYGLAFGINSPVKSLDDALQAKDLKFGGLGIMSESDGIGLAIGTLGLDGTIISGYDSGAEISLAAGKGEVDGAVLDVSYLWDVGPQGKELLADPLVIIDDHRSTVFPDVPALSEVADIPTDIAAYMNIYTAWKGRYMAFMGPDVPADKVKFISDTLTKIFADEGFLRQMGLRYPVIDPPSTGEESAAIIKKAESVSQEDVDGFQDLIRSVFR